MSTSFKYIRCIFIFTLCIFLVVGCSHIELSDSESTPSDSATIELKWWSFPVFAQNNNGDLAGTYEQDVIHAFEAQNPNIKIKLTMLDYSTGPEKLTLALRNNSGCDVLFDAPGRIMEYGKSGYLAPLNDIFTSDLVADMDSDEIQEACKFDHTPYMYPLSSAPFYMAFNKQMLEDSGVLELVDENWTTDDFTEVIQALHEHGYVPGSIFCKDTGGDQGTRAFVANLFDGKVINNTLTKYQLGESKGLQALEYVKDCQEKGLILNGTLLNATESNENFVYGRSSFTILWGPNQQKSFTSIMNSYHVETVEVPLPSMDGVPELEYLLNGFCVMDNGNAAKIAASKKFVQFLCDDSTWGPQNVIHTGCIPVRNSFGNLYSSDERMEQITKWTRYYSVYYNTVNGFSTMRNAWYPTLQDILGGYKTPKEALASFENTANASLLE